MQIKVVTLAAWCALEDRLAARYPKATWRADAILTGLMGFPYWRIPTHEDVHEQTGGLSRSALVRRRVKGGLPEAMIESPLVHHHIAVVSRQSASSHCPLRR